MTMMEVLGVDNLGIFDRLEGLLANQREKESTEELRKCKKSNSCHFGCLLVIPIHLWTGFLPARYQLYKFNIRNSLWDQWRGFGKDEEMIAMILSNLGLSVTYNMASSKINIYTWCSHLEKGVPICLCVSDKSDSFVMTGAWEKVNRKW